MDSIHSKEVALAIDSAVAQYPAAQCSPFHPSTAYPEYPFPDLSSSPNPVYAMVRQALADLGLDRDRFGRPDWNPLGALVQPGARIVIKPNWVLDRNEGNGGMDCLITHPSVVRAVLDYALLTRPLELILGDAPLQGCDFSKLTGGAIAGIIQYCSKLGVPIRLVDFRRTILNQRNFELTVHEDARSQEQYHLVDIGSRSLLEPISGDADRFRVTMYDPRKMQENHRPGVHRYLVAREVLSADLILNLAKLKTHKKAGLTGALKNMVGINGNKDYLPHHRKGARAGGRGDCYESGSPLRSWAEGLLDFANRRMRYRILSRECRRLVYYLLVLDMKLGGLGEVEGGWHGNDTIWRTCLDLQRLLLYADKNGALRDRPQRIELSIIDAIIAGEGEGPLKPDPHPLGAIIAGLNPCACDWICALMMGINPEKIPAIANAFALTDMPLARFKPLEITCAANDQSMSQNELTTRWGHTFKLSRGWRGHSELKR